MTKSFGLAVALGLLCAGGLWAQNERTISLKELFDLADANSKVLKTSATGIDIQRKAAEATKNGRLPNIEASLSVAYLGDGTLMDRDFGNAMRAPMPHFGNNFALEAQQVVFAGGAISKAIEKAELEVQIAELGHQKRVQDVRFLLVGQYLNLYKLLNQREVYQKNIEQTELLIKEVRGKHKQGMALSNDITRYELILQNYRLALIEIDNQRKILNHHLVTTLGLGESTLVIPDKKVLEMVLPTLSAEDLWREAKAYLPELQQATLQIKADEQQLKIAKAGWLPSVAIVAQNHLDGPITIEVPPIDKNFNYWYVGVGLKYNLSSLFKTGKEVAVARASLATHTSAQALLEEQAQVAIHDEWLRLRESVEKLSVFEKSVQLANENYKIINNRYLNDLVLISEMLDASNTQLNAELQLVNARLNILYQYYKVQRSIGRLSIDN
ncbi:transporter [Capnocytophaga sp. HP1101]